MYFIGIQPVGKLTRGPEFSAKNFRVVQGSTSVDVEKVQPARAGLSRT